MNELLIWLLSRTPPPSPSPNPTCPPGSITANVTSIGCVNAQLGGILATLFPIFFVFIALSFIVKFFGDFEGIKHHPETIDLRKHRGIIWRLVRWLFYRKKKPKEGETSQ